MATNCIQKQSEQKNTELTYLRVSEEGVWNPYYQIHAFLENNNELYLLQSEYLNNNSQLGSSEYRLKLYKILDGCTLDSGDCLETIFAYNPTNDMLNFINEFLSHPYFSNETNITVRYNPSNNQNKNIIFKTTDGFYFVKEAFIEVKEQVEWATIYLFYSSVYFIYKVTHGTIVLEGIYHRLSFYPQVPDSEPTGIVHLKDNVFLVSYLDYDNNSESFTLYYTYHVFSVGFSNGQPSITTIKVETITENYLTDTSHLLENFSIDLDVYDGYYSVLPFTLNPPIRKIYSDKMEFLEPFVLYVSTSANGKYITLYLGYIRVVSLDENFNFSFSNYFPFVRENPEEFYKISYLSSLGSGTTYTNDVNIYDDILHSELYYKKICSLQKKKIIS